MKIPNNAQTPFFLVDVNKLDVQADDIRTSLVKYWPNGIVGYSFKTNNLPWIITHLKERSLWAEVVSSDEYNLAKACGYTVDKIIFNGPVKRKQEFVDAIENGAIVNIDSKRELEWLTACDKEKLANSKIGLRVNFCIEEHCPGESQCGDEDGRFGFSYETGELFDAITFLKKNNIKLSGLHLHCSSKTRSLNIYRAIAEVAVKIVNEYKLNLCYVDIGGGFFGGLPDKPSFNDYFKFVYSIFSSEERLSNICVIVEPGMAIVGAAIEYVTSVVDVKKTKNNCFVVLDGSRIHIDPLMKKSHYSYRVLQSEDEKTVHKCRQTLCGFTCMEADRFFDEENVLLAVGDKIVFEKVGAYTIGLSPQFIEFYPAVYAGTDEESILVRPKFTSKNFMFD